MERSIPEKSVGAFDTPLTIGPINIEAKNTWAISLVAADNAFNLAFELMFE